jgi:hypothetical protein
MFKFANCECLPGRVRLGAHSVYLIFAQTVTHPCVHFCDGKESKLWTVVSSIQLFEKYRLDHRYHSQGCSQFTMWILPSCEIFQTWVWFLALTISMCLRVVYCPKDPSFTCLTKDRWLPWLPRSAKSWQKPSRWSLELNVVPIELLCNVRDDAKKNLVLHNRGPSLNITRRYKKGTYCVIPWLFLDLSTLISPSSWTGRLWKSWLDRKPVMGCPGLPVLRWLVRFVEFSGSSKAFSHWRRYLRYLIHDQCLKNMWLTPNCPTAQNPWH